MFGQTPPSNRLVFARAGQHHARSSAETRRGRELKPPPRPRLAEAAAKRCAPRLAAARILRVGRRPRRAVHQLRAGETYSASSGIRQGSALREARRNLVRSPRRRVDLVGGVGARGDEEQVPEMVISSEMAVAAQALVLLVRGAPPPARAARLRALARHQEGDQRLAAAARGHAARGCAMAATRSRIVSPPPSPWNCQGSRRLGLNSSRRRARRLPPARPSRAQTARRPEAMARVTSAGSHRPSTRQRANGEVVAPQRRASRGTRSLIGAARWPTSLPPRARARAPLPTRTGVRRRTLGCESLGAAPPSEFRARRRWHRRQISPRWPNSRPGQFCSGAGRVAHHRLLPARVS